MDFEKLFLRFFRISDLQRQREILQRSATASKAQIVTAAFLLLFKPQPASLFYANLFLVVVLGATTFRYLFSTQNLNTNKDVFAKLSLIYFVQLFGWMGLIFQYVGISVVETPVSIVFGYMLAIAIVTGAVQSFSLSRPLFLLTAIAMSIPALSEFVTAAALRSTDGPEYLVFYYFIFAAYLEKQRGAQESLWEKHQKLSDEFQEILDSVPGAISLVRDEKYVYVNNEVLKITGLPYEKIIGQKVGVKFPDGAVPKMVRKLKDSDESRFSEETVFKTEAGHKDYLIFGNRLESGDISIVSFDVTSINSLKRELESQKVRSQQSAKMAALGEMSGGLSHEINNPLAIISGNAYRTKQLVAKEIIDIAAVNRLSDSTLKVVQRISKIVVGLKNFARDGDKDPFLTTNIKDIIQETLIFCESRFKNHGIEVRKVNIETDLFIECRAVQISQVLLNILNNAHDAALNSQAPWVEIKLESDENSIFLKVIDSGPGIPESNREKIMDPFFTTKEAGKGTGLGLSISKGLIEDNKGEIYFDFKASHTTAVVRIPRVAGARFTAA